MRLSEQKCAACEGFAVAFHQDYATKMMEQIPGWTLAPDAKSISRRFEFKGFNKVMMFLNAMAWIVQEEGHHPDVCYGYNYVTVSFTTHSLQGLSENDFICAAKVGLLLS